MRAKHYGWGGSVGAVALAMLLAAPAWAQAPCAPSQPAAAGWQLSFHSACIDRAGRLAGGSEIIHLVAHGGRLFAATGYWMDPRNIVYGGKDAQKPWAQILALDRADGAWRVDLDLGPRHLRAEILQSVRFTTDAQGKGLAAPVELLLAGAYDGNGDGGISLFARDDRTGTWQASKIVAGPTGRRGEENSVRALRVYRDKAIGIERIFVSIGTLGVYSGVYDAQAPASIRWDAKPELAGLEMRPLALVEANGALHISAGAKIFRRVDGAAPRYELVHDMADQAGGPLLSPVGGIRGLTAIANPGGPGQSLLFAWNPGARSRGCVFRLDPDGKGGYARHQEACIDDLVSRYLGGNGVFFVLAGYNDFLPVVDPAAKVVAHLVGLEAWIGGARHPTTQRKENGGYYAGALYAIRDGHGKYRIGEVNGPIAAEDKPLVAARSYTISPFAGEAGIIYFAGYDANFVRAEDTAWIFKTGMANALRGWRTRQLREQP